MANEGERGARQALQQIDRMAEFIAACQVGITLASIGIGFLGEPALASCSSRCSAGSRTRVAVAISVTFAFLLVTSIHITFGELTPKMLAITAGRDDGPGVLARPLGAFRVISAPFTLGLTKIANAIVRLFGVPGIPG